MKCVSCNSENQEGAKFCRSCGAKLELSAIIKQTASLVKCISCGSNNIASAKFCAKCGKKMTGEASPIPVESSTNQTPAAPTFATPSNPPASAILPQAPREPEPAAVRTAPAAHQERIGQPDIPTVAQKVAPNRKGIYAFVAIAIALIAIGGGSYFVIQYREEQRLALEKVKLEMENKARMELEEKQRALAAAEQARRQAEEQTAKILQEKEKAEAKQKELEAQRREAELKQREAEVKRQATDVKRRETEAMQMELEAKERQARAAAETRNRELARAQQEAARREADERRQRAAAVQPPPAQPGTQTAKELCANRPNFISRGICESRECQKPEHQEEAVCKQMKESAGR